MQSYGTDPVKYCTNYNFCNVLLRRIIINVISFRLEDMKTTDEVYEMISENQETSWIFHQLVLLTFVHIFSE